MSVLISVDKLRPDPQNPRRAGVGDVSDLAASMASVGVLQPLLATPDPEVEGGFLVVFGHRRLAGAIAANLAEVPAEVRDIAPVDRLAIQLIENLERSAIDELDEALAYERLSKLGLSQHAVAERVGRSQSHICKRLALLRLPAAARKALDSGEITVSDALQLTRLKEAGRVTAALKNGLQWGDIGRAVDIQAREAEEAVKRAKAIKELTAKGVKVIQVDHWQSYGRKERALGNGYDQLHVKADVHAKQPCHAAVVERSARVTLVCTRPDRHPEWKKDHGNGRGPLTDDEKAKRALKRAHNKDRRAAEATRAETLAKLLHKRLPKAAVFEQVVIQGLNTANLPARRLACEALGLKPVPPASPYGGEDYTTPLVEYAAEGPVQLERVGLALAFGAAEPELRQDWPQWTSAAAKRHFWFLESQGYEISPAEQLELDGEAPR